MMEVGARHIFRGAIDILVEHQALSYGHVFITMLQIASLCRVSWSHNSCSPSLS